MLRRMQSLVDFLNHGLLPFSGRDAELQRLMEFWQRTAEGSGLRAALLSGEAGVGKSRLIAELIPQVRERGGVVLHTKLYPEAASALAPLLCRAMRDAAPAPLLGTPIALDEVETSMSSALGLLRRLARLRPTLLIIEDVHLLQNAPLAELRTMLESLCDELLSVLLLARPVELPARGVIERYLVDEVQLQGLDREEVTLLIRDLTGGPPSPRLLDALVDATHGNPLALRSAIRGVIHVDPSGLGVSIDESGIDVAVEQRVRLISEGMAAHLDADDAAAARRLALLGEVISREAATMLLGDHVSALDSLIFNGILTPTTVPTPTLSGSTSAWPTLAFTHTLLHRHLVDTAEDAPDALLRVIAEDVPLYSSLPFGLLQSASVATDVALAHAAIDTTLAAARRLDGTPDWELGLRLWDVARLLAERIAPELAPAAWRLLEARLVQRRLELLKRADFSEEYATLIEQLLQLTDSAPTPELAELRLAALAAGYRAAALQPQRQWTLDNWQAAEALLAVHPEIQFGAHYATFLRDTIFFAAVAQAAQLEQLAVSRFERIVDMPSLSEAVGERLLRTVGPELLFVFSTQDELQRRRELCQRLRSVLGEHNVHLRLVRINFHMAIGEDRQALELIEETIPLMKQQGLWRSLAVYEINRLRLRAELGGDFEEMLRDADTCIDSAHDSMVDRLHYNAGIHLSLPALLRNEPTVVRTLISRHLGGPEHLPIDMRLMLVALEGTSPQTLREFDVEELSADPPLREILAPLAERSESGTRASAAVLRKQLAEPLLRTEHLVRRRLLIEIAEGQAFEDDERVSIDAAIAEALLEMLRWLYERDLAPAMRAVLERHGQRLKRNELRSWRERAAEVEARLRPTREEPEGRLSISMLGTISYATAGGELVPIRGGRLRTVLGLLVADAMLRTRLEHREFCYLASGGGDDPELARKTMNGAIFRLRELLGADAILTDSDTPRLNLAAVRVDLLEAFDHLRAADRAMADSVLVRAWPATLRALEISNGEVVFPTLYDDFFEAAREDFETRVRSSVIRVSRALLAENDPQSAETVLSRAYRGMPEDEEIAELLRDALVRLARSAEGTLRTGAEP